MEVKVLRCSTCRKGVQLMSEDACDCPNCGSNKWSNRAGKLSTRERIEIYKRTGILIIDEDMGHLQKFALVALASATGRKKT